MKKNQQFFFSSFFFSNFGGRAVPSVYKKSDLMPHFEVDETDPQSRHKGKLNMESHLESVGANFTSVRPVYIYGPLNYNPVEEWFFHRIAAGRWVEPSPSRPRNPVSSPRDQDEKASKKEKKADAVSFRRKGPSLFRATASRSPSWDTLRTSRTPSSGAWATRGRKTRSTTFLGRGW